MCLLGVICSGHGSLQPFFEVQVVGVSTICVKREGQGKSHCVLINLIKKKLPKAARLFTKFQRRRLYDATVGHLNELTNPS